MNNRTIVVVGGGAAGLMAGGTAAAGFKERGISARVIIIDKNAKMGRKIMITGKGRCNLTNNSGVENCVANTPRNGKFLFSAFSQFSPKDTVDFFESHGVPLKIERGNRVFPVSDKAHDVVDALAGFARDSGCEFRRGKVSRLILDDDNDCLGVVLDGGHEIKADGVVIATGGKSYPLTGSTGDGYELARQAGHTISDIRPSLISLESSAAWCVDLAGLSLKNCAVRLFEKRDGKKDKCIFDDFGEMLFTHTGVSGPMVLSASAHIKSFEFAEYNLHIDLKPALSFEKLEARLLREIEENINKDYINLVHKLLPSSMCGVFAEMTGISQDTKCHSITRTQRHTVIETLKDFVVPISGFRPIDEAIVTCGGVKVKEIDPKTMKSKLVSGLSFAGEVMDVDAYTGGYNLQIAFSTGSLAGKNVI